MKNKTDPAYHAQSVQGQTKVFFFFFEGEGGACVGLTEVKGILVQLEDRNTWIPKQVFQTQFIVTRTEINIKQQHVYISGMLSCLEHCPLAISVCTFFFRMKPDTRNI